eukprot:scaffold49887_cov33-Tisochrysis_lutea.AAC.3
MLRARHPEHRTIVAAGQLACPTCRPESARRAAFLPRLSAYEASRFVHGQDQSGLDDDCLEVRKLLNMKALGGQLAHRRLLLVQHDVNWSFFVVVASQLDLHPHSCQCGPQLTHCPLDVENAWGAARSAFHVGSTSALLPDFRLDRSTTAAGVGAETSICSVSMGVG